MKIGDESETLEFKKSTSEINEAIIDIVAILNKHGQGALYFGVKNDGEICGFEVSDTTARYISTKIYEQIKPQIFPQITIISNENKKYIEILFSGNQKPYSAEGKYYIRVSDQSRELTPIELANAFCSLDYENWENRETSESLDDVDEEKLKWFLETGINCQRIEFTEYNKKIVLLKLNLLSKDNYHLNNAGKYLFSKNKPIKLKLAVFATNMKQTFIDISIKEGNIFQLIECAEKYIKEHINWKVEIEGFKRREIPEISIEALREIIINSFAHANYISNSTNEIDIHPNRIAIYNPGAFPDGYTPEDFVTKNLSSKIRNKIICDVLYKCKTVETWGTGFRNTYNICNHEKIKIDYEKEYDGFWFFFYRNNYINVLNEKNNLTEIEKIVFSMIESNSKITREIIAQKSNRTIRQIQRVIDSLKEKGYIKRVGSNKTGYWEIL